ncbi:MAG: FtsK/SpoIIIE domain-containing protein [Actinomycetota bacterium]
MRIKLTLLRGEGTSTNLAVTADATATVADVATSLFAGDPAHKGEAVPPRLTLRIAESMPAPPGQGRVLDPATELLSAGVRSGSSVALAQVSEVFADPGQDRGPAAAIVRVLAGPDAGREFPLPVGASYLGRDRDMDVRLVDPLVSKRHARVNVSDGVEIIDLNSANGLVIGGSRVVRATLTSADSVSLGDSIISVVALQRTANVAPSNPVIEFNRSPRVLRRVPAHEVPAPTPPGTPNTGRFPLIAMVAPLVMGAALWFLTHQLMSLLFVALSPLLMVGSWADQRMTAKRTFKAQKKQFEAATIALEEKIAKEHAVERAIRLAANPSVPESCDAVERLSSLMWTIRPEHTEFLTVRLGLGSAISRLKVRMPSGNETLPEFWSRLEDLSELASVVEGVPIVGDLRQAGAIGIAGPADAARPVALGVVLQLAALHSPAELVMVALASPRSRSEWEWLDWLPHTGSAHSPLIGEHLADNPGTGARLLERLEALIEARLSVRDGANASMGPLDPGAARVNGAASLPAVVVIVEDDAPLSRSRLTQLAERGPEASVHVLWVAGTVSSIPAACRTFLLVDPQGSTAGEVRMGELRFPVTCDPLTVEQALRLARAMTPVVDVGAPIDDDSDLPRAVSYAALAGVALLDEPGTVVERWRETGSLTVRDGSVPVRRKSDATLHALVGHAGSAPLSLDLRTQGPHALVGGTTGAGKSEFLQSWVLGIATKHSPDRVTFLFVDYKGGAAFADCVDLPHTVGLVTDLSTHLVRRALTSLRAELRHREQLLNRKKAKDLVSLERTGDPETPPSLIIIVDEFAALATEVPEFVDGIVDVAQRGRSLGLHLILATQRPAGVIKDNLRANTNLRVALRMADEDDSTDILGVPLAAHVDPSLPGRGAVKTGPGRVTSFQTGYAGGWTSVEPEPVRIDVAEMDFGDGARWEMPALQAGPVGDPGPNDIARMVGTIRRAAREVQVPAPRRPWLPELATTYDFSRLPNPRSDSVLVLGVMDEPSTQSQPTFSYEPDRDGNMAIYGSGGSGKSATLRALAVAAAVTPRGGPVQVYGLDFGSNGLQPICDLPHVGAIVDGDDEERVGRLIRMIRDIVDERAGRYAAVRAGSISEYRERADSPQEARLLLLVDGIAAFREAYEFSPSQLFGIFSQIAADGRPLGVHVIITGDRPNAVPMSVASTIQRRLVLRLASEDDYLLLNVAKDVLDNASPPGRGMLEGNEVQVAILGGDSNLAVQARKLAGLAESMVRNGVVAAPPIGRLPTRVNLSGLPCSIADRPVFGVDDETLLPAALEPRGTLMLAGPPGSGRTTALLTLAQAMRRARPGVQITLMTSLRTSLVGLPVFDSWHTSLEDIAVAADQLSADLEKGGVAAGSLVLILEALTDLSGTVAEPSVERLVKACVRGDQFVVGESESSTWGQAWALAQPFKAGRRGLLLVPGDMDGDSLLGTSLGRLRRKDFSPGRGFLIGGGRASKLQVAIPS